MKTENDLKVRADLVGWVKKIPGGLLLLPMFVGAIINTFFPKILQIGAPTTSIFTSAGIMPITGIMLVFVGIQLDGKTLFAAMKRGGVLVIAKLLISIVFGILVLRFFGLKGFWGLSSLALVCCIASVNPGIYVALMNQFGDKLDLAIFALLNLIGQPMVSICILLYSSGQGIDYNSIIATCIPFAVGLALGALDPRLKAATKNGITIATPFLGLCLGNNINIIKAFSQFLPGILLFVLFQLISTAPLLFIDRNILKQKGHASTALSCVAGLAIAVPKMVAELNSSFAPYVETATSQLVMAVILCTITCPIIVKKLAEGRK